MSNYKKIYSLPDKTTTTDVDEFVGAWRTLAEPIERTFDLQLVGFDPSFQFRKGNPHGQYSKVIDLPVWFVQTLGEVLSKAALDVRLHTDVMMVVNEQLTQFEEQLPEGFDRRVCEWTAATAAGAPPNLRVL